MKVTDEILELVCPNSRQQWRNWLIENHVSKKSVWLIYYKKSTNLPSITRSEAVDEALCFGWIDSISKPIDDERFKQFFSRRNPKSTWSRINKEKVLRLTEAGLMTAAGQHCIETAKQNGSWEMLDLVELLIVPDDLELAFKNQLEAKTYFLGLSKSVIKAILQWLVLAKRQETRQNRIMEISRFCSEQVVPKQFRPVRIL